MEFSSSVDKLISRIKSDLKPVNNGRYVVAFARNERSLNERLTFQCESAPLPGMSLTDTEVSYGAGTTRKMPSTKTFANEIELTFRLSRSMRERLFFEEWMNTVCNPETLIFNYYKNYIDDMSITVQDSLDVPIYGVVFEEVYPTEVSPIDLSPKGDYLKQTVKFAYYRWRNTNTPNGTQQNLASEFTGTTKDSLSPWGQPEAAADAGKLIRYDPKEFDQSHRPWRQPYNAESSATEMSGHPGETSIDSGGRIASDGGILPGGDTFLA